MKRAFDVVASALAAFLLLPVILMVALVVRWQMGSPVLFRQIRPGLHAKPFAMYKFRTMLETRDTNGNLVPDSKRLTRLGRFLRS